MRLHRPALVGLVGLSVLAAGLTAPVAAFAATAPPPDATITATACTDTHWPLSVQGQPTLFHVGALGGDYIWHDLAGWHVRVTHPGTSRVVFSGRIVATAPMRVAPVRLEGGDTIALSADRLTLTYRLSNHGGIDGFNFQTACARRIAFSGAMSGALLPISRIWIGRANHHPLQNPFAIVRLS
jgi:hypothetical protein